MTLRPGAPSPKPPAAAPLATIAPRLARARTQRVLELRLERAARRLCRHELLAAEMLLAHRELQALRAGARCRSRTQRTYVAERDRKLNAARELLARVQARAQDLGV